MIRAAAGLILALVILVPQPGAGALGPLKRIAFLIDSWHPISHADVIGTRFLEGYRIQDRTYPSPVTVASVYQTEPRANTIARAISAKYGVRLASSVAEALLDDPRAPQPRLAVDGVLIAVRTPLPVGATPADPSAQFRVFRETMAAFDRAGTRAPVFVDKNLAATWEESQTLVAEGARRGVPLMAGSVVPWVPLIPPPPTGRKPTLAVAVASAPYALYAIHVADLLQTFLESRGPRETGVSWVREVGRGLWALPDRDRWGLDVLEALLGTARTRGARAAIPPGGLDDRSYVVLVQYADGTRGVVALLLRMFDDSEFLLGARYDDRSAPYLGSIVLGGAPYDHFGYLVHALAQFYVTGRPQAAVERTLLATGISLFGQRSRENGGQTMTVPTLAVTYSPPTAR